MHILIPCKNLAVGKSRLSECLDSGRRRTLCERLLTQTLKLALRLASPAQVYIVTADPQATAIAAHHGVGGLHDPSGGLNSALEAGRAALLAEAGSVGSLLILPIDLPYASPDAIGKVMSCVEEAVIAPDEGGTGTNLLLLRQATLQRLSFRYGADSYAAHHAAARSLGLDIATVKDWRLAFDLDGPAQYAAWRAQEAAS